MATKIYSAPNIPQTPSQTINSMLQQRCNKTFDNPVKYAIATYICLVFTGITQLYNIINQKKPAPSHTFWMIACGVVGVALVLKSYLAYQLIMASAIFVGAALYWGFIALALAGCGLTVAGAVFFDKDGANKYVTPTAPTAGFEKDD